MTLFTRISAVVKQVTDKFATIAQLEKEIEDLRSQIPPLNTCTLGEAREMFTKRNDDDGLKLLDGVYDLLKEHAREPPTPPPTPPPKQPLKQRAPPPPDSESESEAEEEETSNKRSADESPPTTPTRANKKRKVGNTKPPPKAIAAEVLVDLKGKKAVFDWEKKVLERMNNMLKNVDEMKAHFSTSEGGGILKGLTNVPGRNCIAVFAQSAVSHWYKLDDTSPFDDVELMMYKFNKAVRDGVHGPYKYKADMGFHSLKIAEAEYLAGVALSVIAFLAVGAVEEDGAPLNSVFPDFVDVFNEGKKVTGGKNMFGPDSDMKSKIDQASKTCDQRTSHALFKLVHKAQFPVLNGKGTEKAKGFMEPLDYMLLTKTDRKIIKVYRALQINGQESDSDSE